MSCKAWITDLYEKMGQGQMHEAFEKYYHEDVKVYEPTGEVREGKEAQRTALKGWEESIQERHDGGVGSITANEESQTTMVESWVDATFKNGARWKLEEVGVQQWKDGQIISERFYYNVPPGAEQS